MQPLTTFTEGEKIVNELLGANVNNLKVRYTGWFNEGINHNIDKYKVDRKIGGKKGLNHSRIFSEKMNMDFYPDVALAKVYRNTLGFNPTRDASRFITKRVAEVTPINLATYWASAVRTPFYLLSPNKLSSHVDGFMNNYEKLDFDHLSIRDLGRGFIRISEKRKSLIGNSQRT